MHVQFCAPIWEEKKEENYRWKRKKIYRFTDTTNVTILWIYIILIWVQSIELKAFKVDVSNHSSRKYMIFIDCDICYMKKIISEIKSSKYFFQKWNLHINFYLILFNYRLS